MRHRDIETLNPLYMFTYQKTNRYFAQIAQGLEQLGAEELEALGAEEVKTSFRGVYFNADPATLYRVNYMSRLCTRVLAPILSFDCHSTKYLYKTARKIKWEQLLDKDTTFAIKASVAESKISHSQYASLCLKDAIVDYFRDREGSRPSIDKKDPDIWFHLRIDRNKAIISLDTSGGSLHRRGYRLESIEAPMQETVAATIIRLTNWDGNTPIIDPMCGSGTLLCEALMHHCHIPAGYLRKKFGFEMMPEFDTALWQTVKTEQNNKIKRLPKGLLAGSDISPEAVAAAKKNSAALPHGDRITFKIKRFQDIKRVENSIIVTNPPYGIRLKNKNEIAPFIADFGNFLKTRCKSSTAFVYLGKPDLGTHIHLKPRWEKPLKNGGLAGVLIKYKI